MMNISRMINEYRKVFLGAGFTEEQIPPFLINDVMLERVHFSSNNNHMNNLFQKKNFMHNPEKINGVCVLGIELMYRGSLPLMNQETSKLKEEVDDLKERMNFVYTQLSMKGDKQTCQHENNGQVYSMCKCAKCGELY